MFVCGFISGEIEKFLVVAKAAKPQGFNDIK
jgi:hypothetical protein